MIDVIDAGRDGNCASCGEQSDAVVIVASDFRPLPLPGTALAIPLCGPCRAQLHSRLCPHDTTQETGQHAQLGLCDFCHQIHPPTDNRENGHSRTLFPSYDSAAKR